MARNYSLDTQAAKEANTGGKRITTTGKYTGTITHAFFEQNERGTESVNVMFVADNGQECGPLPLYTHNGKGEQIAGYKMLNALMTCSKVKELTWKLEPVELYDYSAGGLVTRQRECAVELKNKKIGLVLQQDEYEKQSGETGERMVIAAPFEYGTELMASEILGKLAIPAALGNFMEYIAKNPIRKPRKQRQSQQQVTQQGQRQPAPDADFDSFDSDIPF